MFDRWTTEVLNIEAEEKEWLPILLGNTYIQMDGLPYNREEPITSVLYNFHI